jgi:hypothetical protein
MVESNAEASGAEKDTGLEANEKDGTATDGKKKRKKRKKRSSGKNRLPPATGFEGDTIQTR